MFVISNPQIIHKHNKKSWKGTWTVRYCCLSVTGLGTIKPSLKGDGEVGLAPAEKNWSLMPGHHFQLGNRQAWEGVLFFSGFLETLLARLLNQILILEGFAQLRLYLLASFFLRILSFFSLTGPLYLLAHVRPKIFLLDPFIIGLIPW